MALFHPGSQRVMVTCWLLSGDHVSDETRMFCRFDIVGNQMGNSSC